MQVVMVVVVINLTEQLLYNLSNHFREEIQIGNGTKTFHFPHGQVNSYWQRCDMGIF